MPWLVEMDNKTKKIEQSVSPLVPGLRLPFFVLHPEHMPGHPWVTKHILLLYTSLVYPPGLEASAVVQLLPVGKSEAS